jgi:NADPH-dependent ferric siderophore reductase
MHESKNSMEKHKITKERRDTVRRKLRVATKEHITPGMLRIVFHSDELEGFDSPSPDDHIKIFIPMNGEQQVKRDFTPRAWNLEAGTFTLDFALHESGPATEWARSAKIGDVLEIGGPRGSTIVLDDFDWYLLIGDASALPSFSRRLETMRQNVPVHLFLLIKDASEQQTFSTKANCRIRWLTNGCNSVEDALILGVALDNFALPQGDGFVWIAAEKTVSREFYRYLVEEREHPAEWVKAAAYWTEFQQ